MSRRHRHPHQRARTWSYQYATSCVLAALQSRSSSLAVVLLSLGRKAAGRFSLGGRLPLLPQHIDEGTKPGRHVPVTGIIEAQTGEWRRPVFQYGLQVSGGEMCSHPEIADEHQPETFERGFDHQAVIVEGEPARHIHGHRLAALFEL